MNSTTAMTATTIMPPGVDSQNVTQRSTSPNTAVRASTDNERFPSFDFSAQPPPGLPISESPAEARPIEYKWPSRRASQRIPVRQGNAPSHRQKRSLSDALAKFRNRQGSVSENAQELAEALKAPISYRLIVSAQFLVVHDADSGRHFALSGI